MRRGQRYWRARPELVRECSLAPLPQLTDPEALENLEPTNFGCMAAEYPTQYGSYPLLAQTPLENTVYTLTGSEDGHSIYMGGAHGDELAGWYAGVLFRKATLRARTVYVVAPLDQYGADHVQRKMREGWNLNRAFPGDAQRIAAAVYHDIQDKQPDLVLDLHEAILHTNGQDNLGNSLICQDMELVADLVLALLSDSGNGVLPLSEPLTLYGFPPRAV